MTMVSNIVQHESWDEDGFLMWLVNYPRRAFEKSDDVPPRDLADELLKIVQGRGDFLQAQAIRQGYDQAEDEADMQSVFVQAGIEATDTPTTCAILWLLRVGWKPDTLREDARDIRDAHEAENQP